MTRERAVKGPPRTKLPGRGVELTLHTEVTFCDLNLTLSQKMQETKNVELHGYYQKNRFSFKMTLGFSFFAIPPDGGSIGAT